MSFLSWLNIERDNFLMSVIQKAAQALVLEVVKAIYCIPDDGGEIITIYPGMRASRID